MDWSEKTHLCNAVAVKAGAVRALLSSHAIKQETESADNTCLALSALPVLLADDDSRGDFCAADGVETLASLLDRWTGTQSSIEFCKNIMTIF